MLTLVYFCVDIWLNVLTYRIFYAIPWQADRFRDIPWFRRVGVLHTTRPRCPIHSTRPTNNIIKCITCTYRSMPTYRQVMYQQPSNNKNVTINKKYNINKCQVWSGSNSYLPCAFDAYIYGVPSANPPHRLHIVGILGPGSEIPHSYRWCLYYIGCTIG